MNYVKAILKKLFNIHLLGGAAIMLFVSFVIYGQVSDRTTFANTELYDDVMDRWGAPINQPAPSVRYIETGSVFTDLERLPLSGQTIVVDAVMNYRKRGLAYFSGFDFTFSGTYSLVNTQPHDIDIVFVFPINLQSNKVLLSDLTFHVNGSMVTPDLSETSDKLKWTGRVKEKGRQTFKIAYKGRGLDSFTYFLDPSLAVRNFSMTYNISGGVNFDYPHGVIPANKVAHKGNDRVSLEWGYKSLESGVPVGLILPSEKSFAAMIGTMTKRSFVTFCLFFCGVLLSAQIFKKQLKVYQTYLIAACYAFFYVLLAYLAAFMNFYAAYLITLTVISALLIIYVSLTVSKNAGYVTAGLLCSFLIVPSTAVIIEGYTGLIYTIEILVGLAALMWLSTKKNIQAIIENSLPLNQKGVGNESVI